MRKSLLCTSTLVTTINSEWAKEGADCFFLSSVCCYITKSSPPIWLSHYSFFKTYPIIATEVLESRQGLPRTRVLNMFQDFPKKQRCHHFRHVHVYLRMADCTYLLGTGLALTPVFLELSLYVFWKSQTSVNHHNLGVETQPIEKCDQLYLHRSTFVHN